MNGDLEPIAFDGPSFFRLPAELERIVVEQSLEPDAVVPDPFCGFGTTVVEAQGRAVPWSAML